MIMERLEKWVGKKPKCQGSNNNCHVRVVIPLSECVRGPCFWHQTRLRTQSRRGEQLIYANEAKFERSLDSRDKSFPHYAGEPWYLRVDQVGQLGNRHPAEAQSHRKACSQELDLFKS